MSKTDFLLNIKKWPDRESNEYDAFWDNERKKAEYGLTTGGVFIPPFLYWHTQLWKIYVDIEDPINKVVKRNFQNPDFRDNEWLIAEGFEEATALKKGLMIFGSRRLGKSEFLSSHIGRYATLFEGSENVVMGGNWADIDIIMFKLSQGLNKLPDYFKFGRLSDNLRKEVELGFKDKKGTRISWSKIIARNHEEGNNSEAPAGLTASSFVMDEIGKSKFSQVFEAAKPAFTSPFGWRCVPVLTGTSGDIKASSDAEIFFNNPEAHNFLVKELKEEGGKKVSLFISGLRRMEGKYKTTLANYIETEKGILIPKDNELHTIPFYNSDFEKAEKIIDTEREAAAKSPDPTALTKAIMYYPKNTKELFLRDNDNNFPIEAINEQIEYVLANPELQGIPVRLYRDVDGKVKISYNTNKKPLNEYPLKPGENFKKDAPVVIYEPPVDNIPTYLYISGADPYNQSNSKWSNSVGACYIFKRISDPISGTYQRRIVASYVARPDNLKEFHETIEMLLELYNCVCMPENEEGTFIQHFDNKNKSHYLADGYDFLREIHPKSSINRPKGLPAIVKVQNFYKQLVYTYLTEEVVIGVKDNGELIKKLGVVRITDLGLLRELALYNKDGNFDRYVAFGHALAHEVWADKIYPIVIEQSKPVEKKENTQQINIKGPFDLKRSNPFGIKTGNNPFGVSPTKVNNNLHF